MTDISIRFVAVIGDRRVGTDLEAAFPVESFGDPMLLKEIQYQIDNRVQEFKRQIANELGRLTESTAGVQTAGTTDVNVRGPESTPPGG